MAVFESNFDVLLTVYLSIILVIGQLNAQIYHIPTCFEHNSARNM